MIRLAKALARRILGKELALLESALREAEQEAARSPSIVQSCLYGQALQTIKELEEQLDSLSKAPLIEYKITREVYKKHIVDKLEQPMVNSTVTPHQAAYLLGIQRALKVVEEMVV